MVLFEMADMICADVGKSDAVTNALVKGWLRKRYEQIWDLCLWRESLTFAKVGATQYPTDDSINRQIIVIPNPIGKVLKVRYDDTNALAGMELGTLFDVDPAVFDETGTAAAWASLTQVATSKDLNGDTPYFTSDNAADTGSSITITGDQFVAGDDAQVPLVIKQVRETVALNGITRVDAVNQYKSIYTLSKGTTLGTVSVLGDDSDASYGELYPEEHERKYQRIQLFRPPAESTKAVLVLGKRLFPGLIADLSTCMLRGIEGALIAYATGDLWARMRQFSKAQLKWSEGASLVQQEQARDQAQTGVAMQIVPFAPEQYEDANFACVTL